MAFQLQAFKAYGLRLEGSTRQQARQVAVLQIAQANTDTALDISSAAGTFWTAALADATYGALAAAALAKLQAIQAADAAVGGLLSVDPPVNYVQVSSGAAGKQYTMTVTNSLPSIVWVSGQAPTSYVLTLEWTLADNQEALAADLGANF